MSRRSEPGFVAGTSSEYLGSRPLRRAVRERPIVVLLGPAGAGKTSVAQRIASHGGSAFVYLNTDRIKEEVVARVRRNKWPRILTSCHALVLDGPVFLRSRPGVEDLLVSLVRTRIRNGVRTILCDVSGDGSCEAILDRLQPGSSVVVGLRFPRSRSGRMRFARRQCDRLGIPRSCATGTDSLEPWGYARVIEALRRCDGQPVCEIGEE